MMNDLLSDGITRIRNGFMRGLNKVSLMNSKLVREVLKVLQREGYIEEFSVTEDTKAINVTLRYYKNKPAMKYINRISRCSKRIYTNVSEVPKTKSLFGLFILSTNKGILTHVESKKINVGGEILLEVF
ncbi:MAG: 30S ribosomal protein S8 [Bacteroidota bacterium]